MNIIPFFSRNHLNLPNPEMQALSKSAQNFRNNNQPPNNQQDKSIDIIHRVQQSYSMLHEPWTQFGPYENRILTNHFITDNDLTLGYTIKTQSGSKFKGRFGFIFKANQIEIRPKNKLSLIFNKQTFSGISYLGNAQHSKFHFENGLIKNDRYYFDLYGSLCFDRNWRQSDFKLGCLILFQDIFVDNRLKKDYYDDYLLYHRTSGRFGNWMLGGVLAFNLTENKIVKKNILIRYQNILDVTLKARQNFDQETRNYGDWRQWFNQYLMTVVLNKDKKQIGFEYVYKPFDKNTLTGVVELVRPTFLAKVKFNQNFYQFSLKKEFADCLTLGIGANVPFYSKAKVGLQILYHYG